MGVATGLEDLRELSPELVQGFDTMLQYEGDDFAELYDRTFTYTRDGAPPQRQ